VTLTDWTNCSIVLLAIEGAVFVLVVGFIVFQSIRGTRWLTKSVRFYSPLVQSRFRDVANATEKASQQIASPFIDASAATAKARRLLLFLAPSAKGREKT